ncbi:MAG: UbiA prenyltransferase family protein [Sedimentisphaerales bacterium]
MQWIKNGFVIVPLLFSGQFQKLSQTLKATLAFLAFCSVSALILSLILIFLGIFASAILSWKFLATVIVYLSITIAYSLKLKHVVIIDVMVVAAGFVLRILAGSVAIAVNPSHWIMLCTILISLFLGFAKRRAEMVNEINAMKPSGTSRIVINDYSVVFLDQVISMVASATIVCYALYTVDTLTLETFGTRAMLLTIPFVIYGILRYIYNISFGAK